MNRVIPKKNYVILGVVILASFFLVYYFRMWYDAYLENKLGESILDKYMDVINYNELDDYLVERPNAIVYVSILENGDIRNFEKKFKGLLKNNSINRDILYMNITENNIIIDEIFNKYSNSSVSSVSKFEIPMILVFENGILKDAYNIKENNYDVKLLKSFINDIKFMDEDEF